MGPERAGSHFKAQDPMGIPRGSQRDPKTLLRQSAAFLGDQLIDPLYKVATQTLNVTIRVDVLRDLLHPRCKCIPGAML